MLSEAETTRECLESKILANQIRSIAICLFSHLGKILVCEFPDSVKGDHAARPLGGGIEFGESSEQTIIREIREELSQEIEDIKLLGVLESFFEFEGKRGHENVFVYDAKFKDRSIYDRGLLKVVEGDLDLTACWRSKEELASNVRLVPDGLSALIPGA